LLFSFAVEHHAIQGVPLGGGYHALSPQAHQLRAFQEV
jgi:hypothetical protein